MSINELSKSKTTFETQKIVLKLEIKIDKYMYMQGVLNNRKCYTKTTKLHTTETESRNNVRVSFFNDDFKCRRFVMRKFASRFSSWLAKPSRSCLSMSRMLTYFFLMVSPSISFRFVLWISFSRNLYRERSCFKRSFFSFHKNTNSYGHSFYLGWGTLISVQCSRSSAVGTDRSVQWTTVPLSWEWNESYSELLFSYKRPLFGD